MSISESVRRNRRGRGRRGNGQSQQGRAGSDQTWNHSTYSNAEWASAGTWDATQLSWGTSWNAVEQWAAGSWGQAWESSGQWNSGIEIQDRRGRGGRGGRAGQRGRGHAGIGPAADHRGNSAKQGGRHQQATPICYRCGHAWEEHDNSTNLGPYQKWCLRRFSAGVVACFLDSDTNEPRFLFGEESRRDGGYNIFWGFAEMDESCAWQTAARECGEETLGLLQPGSRLSELGAGLCAFELDGVKNEVPIFVVHLGEQSGKELAKNFEHRYRRWQRSLKHLKPFTPAGKQSGGDTMTRLFSVSAKSFARAASSVADMRPLLGSIRPLTASREVVTSCDAELSPRPPVFCLAEALAQPRTNAARWLCAFCQSTADSAPLPEPGCCILLTPEGNVQNSKEDDCLPDVDTIAAQVLFSMFWTGPNGLQLPREPHELAAAVTGLLFSAERAKSYIKLLVSRAFDSPAAAALIEAHLTAFIRAEGAPEQDLKTAALTEAIDAELSNTLQRVQQAPHNKGDERIAAAYRLLVGLVLVERVDQSFLHTELKHRSIVAEAKARSAEAVNILQPAPKIYWLSPPALASVLAIYVQDKADGRKRRTNQQNHTGLAEVANNYDDVARSFAVRNNSLLPREHFRELNNQLTRQVIEMGLHSSCCSQDLFVDAACGKGGGLPKYVPLLPSGASCVLVDISEVSVQEAQNRASKFQRRGILFQCETDDCFAPEYWHKFGDKCVSAVSCQFALHYAFEDVQRALRMIQEIHRVLMPGGVFFGITTHAETMLHELRGNAKPSSLFAVDTHEGPPGLGGSYYFELDGHVNRTKEFLVPMEDLIQLGAAAGLQALSNSDSSSIFWRSFSDLPEVRAADSDTARLAGLYCAFAFQKSTPAGIARPLVATSTLCDLSVAVYTGSFDPFHQNHAALCRHVLETHGFSHVYLVPNGDNPFKPDAEPVRHRIAMARLGLADAGLTERCSVLQTVAGDWRSRITMSNLAQRSGSSVYFLVGQDSYESSLQRAGENGRRRGKGIFAISGSHRKLLVMPRLGCGTKPPIPKELKGQVDVLEDYTDAMPISSTKVREMIQGGHSLEQHLSGSVLLYIRDHGLYKEKASE